MKPIAVIVAVALAGCAAPMPETQAGSPSTPVTAPAPARHAAAQLVDARGRPAGTARLTEAGGQVSLELNAVGLTPGQHGIHIHEVGRCERPDFKSAGNHFNPHGRQHGTENPKGAHAGDLPNLVASEDGMASAEMKLAGVTLAAGAANSLLDADGSALVIHAKADDAKSDPSGNSGDRVTCGVITAH